MAEDIRLLLKNYSKEKISEIVEVDLIPEMYLHHLQDPEMKQIYYYWDGVHYRLQTRLVNNSCVALRHGEGCVLGENRPLICRVSPFWWKSGSNLSANDFSIEIDGDCTMATHWNLPAEAILKELESSESAIKRELLILNMALKEHNRILRKANKKRIPPKELLDWLLSNITSECLQLKF